MTKQEKFEMLESVMDLDEGVLTDNTSLVDIEEWDSLSVLTLITEMKKRFDITLSDEQIKSFKIVEDILRIIPD